MPATDELKTRFVPTAAQQIGLDRQLHCARFSPCGKFLLGGDFDARIRRWTVDGEEPFKELAALEGHHGWVQPLVFAAEGNLLYSGDSWGRISAWNYSEQQPKPKWTVEDAHDGWVRCLSLSPDGKRLASCGKDRMVRFRSAEDGKQELELAEHGEDVFSVAFHPGGKFLVSGDLKGVVKKWDAATGKCVGQFDAGRLYKYDRIQDVGGVWRLAFDRDGKMLAAAGVTPDHGATVQGVPTVLLFDFESGKLAHTLELGAANQCFVYDLVLHDEGFVIAVTSGTPGTGQFLLHCPGDDAPFFTYTKLTNCHSVSLHPDGKRLAVAATNRGSNGNGRRLNKDGEYEGNNSPIQIFEWTAADAG